MKKLLFTTVLILSGFFVFSQADCDGQRRPIHTMELEDRVILNDLILQYVQSQINPDYDPNGTFPNNLLENKYDIVAQHTNYNMNPPGEPSPWHTGIELFFSWHRDYIAGLEQFILDQGCDICPDLVPLPYWDIIQPLSDPFYNSMIPEFALASALITAPQPLFITPQEETWSDFIEIDESTCTEYESPELLLIGC